MRRTLATLGAVLVALAASAGSAFASGPAESPLSPASQIVAQGATTGEGALAGSSTNQAQPADTAYPDGSAYGGHDGGDVTQSNDASSAATAANTAGTLQAAGQLQPDGCGCRSDLQRSPYEPQPVLPTSSLSRDGSSCGCDGSGGVQAVGQQASTDQAALAASSTTQEDPSNQNISVRVLSPGSSGDVTQTNSADSTATATNDALTAQAAPQGSGGGSQYVGQSADTGQAAGAGSQTTQKDPSNKNISVRVLSPGSNGDVSQTNDASSTATAGNTADTAQIAPQTQSGGGGQYVGQSADTNQRAGALSQTTQEHPSNSNISVRVLSPGTDGDVSQTNDASSTATAGNTAGTLQLAGQKQDGNSCTCGGGGVQAVGQQASTGQAAGAASSVKQDDPSNKNISVRVLSPGSNGDVSQSNDASSTATAGNNAGTLQLAGQKQDGNSCTCGGGGVQAVGQQASTGQLALAGSETKQDGASNTNVPVRIGSHGGGGDVAQSNSASSTADASNGAWTIQAAGQKGGVGCGCKGNEPSIQAIGQSAWTGQLAGAGSSTLQAGASNGSEPVSIGSRSHGGGDVTQSNDASSTAAASNTALTGQLAGQRQSDGGIQALGQKASTGQGAFALSSTKQVPGRESCGCGHSGFGNTYDPVSIGSRSHGGGDVSQTNTAASNADASNAAATGQLGFQHQDGRSCGCGGGGIQALGQEASTAQLAVGLSEVWQVGPHNSSSPTTIGSGGNDRYGGKDGRPWTTAARMK